MSDSSKASFISKPLDLVQTLFENYSKTTSTTNPFDPNSDWNVKTTFDNVFQQNWNEVIFKFLKLLRVFVFYFKFWRELC